MMWHVRGCHGKRRIERYLLELGTITEFPERAGVTRRLYTEAWQKAQIMIYELMCAAGLEAWMDEVGNVHGRLQGSSDQTILTGSHFDTVVDGGAYDGAYGIIAGIVALSELKARQVPLHRSLEVVAFSEEEGSRFPLTCWGSRALVGKIDTEAMLLCDSQGISLNDAMRSVGLNPSRAHPRRSYDYQGFVELHVEQGSQLEERRKPIGIVGTIFGQERWIVRVRGESAHAGTTRMARRHDALVAASEMVMAVYRLSQNNEAHAIATVGLLQVHHGTANCVPGHVTFTVDLRSAHDEIRRNLALQLRQDFKESGIRHGVEVVAEKHTDTAAVSMSSHLQHLTRDVAENLELDTLFLDSRAGHDAQILGREMPAGMIFVPSHQGISHHAREFTSARDLANGERVLRKVLERAANNRYSEDGGG